MKYKYLVFLFLIFTFKSFSIRWYVDDASNVGDYYTSGSLAGNDANTGAFTQPFATVNFALSVAAPFDTICVDAGNYSEKVIVTKDISIFGAGNTLTIFDGANKSAAGGVGFTLSANIVFHLRSLSVINYDTGIIHTAAVTGNTLTTVFDSLNITNNFSNGLRFNSVALLNYFKVNHSTFNFNDGSAIARGILIQGLTVDSAFVLNSNFNTNRLVGIDFNTPDAALLNHFAKIKNCTIINTTAPGIALQGYTGALIEDNTLTDNQFCSIELKTCSGNSNPSGAGSFVVQRNLISQSVPSIQRRDIAGIAITNRDQNVSGGSGTLTSQGIVIIENEIQNFRVLNVNVTTPSYTPLDVTNWAAAPYSGQVPDTLFDAYGILVEGSNHKLMRNKLINCEIGIQVQEQPSFSGTTAPISDFFDANRIYPTPTTSVIAQQNGFYTCRFAYRGVNLSAPIDASNSYFGYSAMSSITNVVVGLTATPIAAFPIINPHFASINPFKPTGIVDFSPWIKNTTDAPPIGYQGDLTYLIVDQQSPNFANRGYVQEGHDTTSGGNVLTVEISPGAYAERNVVNKNVHYIGVLSPTLNTLSMQGLGDTLYVDAGFELKDSLICNNGVITTTATSTILLKETCVSDLGTSTSFVNGPLNAERTSTGSFTLNLPVGKQTVGNRFIKLTLNQTNGSLTTYQSEYFASGAPTIAINAPITPTWVPQSYWFINDGGASNFTNPQITLNYNTNDYSVSNAHTIAKRITSPSIAWDYIKDLSPVFSATSGTVTNSIGQNAKFTQMGYFAIAPFSLCPKVSINTTTTICLGNVLNPVNTTTASPTSTITSYTWDFGDGSPVVVQTGSFVAPFPVSNPTIAPHTFSTATTYTVKLTAINDLGCKDSALVTVNVNALPTGTVTPNSTYSLCPTDSVLVNALTLSNYTWSAIPSLTVVSTSTLMVKNPGKYFVQLEDVFGCRGTSDTLTVINVNCKSYIGVSKALTKADKLNNTDYAVSFRIKAVNYGNSPLTNISLTENLNATFPSPTSFTVINKNTLIGNFIVNPLFDGNLVTSLISAVSNSLAANDSSVVNIDLTVRPSNQTQFNNFVFATATSTSGILNDTSVVGYNPDPNNDGIPNEFSSTPVTLIGDLVIPSGFSPDGDNVNDLFVIQGIETYPDNELQIFNRWGSPVYSKKAYNSSEYWTGAPNTGGLLPGNKVPTGTYYYILKLNANDKPLTGYITIKY